jgi:hypothetical protein
MRLKILLFLLIIPTFIFLLKPGEYWNMHDDMQIIRQYEIEKCLKDGQIPCRWTPDLGYGYGYPLFNFYPPLPYLVGQVYRTFGFSFVATVKLTAVTQILLSVIAMYLLSSVIFGKFGGFLSALFYAYAPYRSVNIFVRGAMNEAWASVFFPFIFYYIYKIINSKKADFKNVLFLSLSIAGLLLSHNPMALTFAPLAILWAIFLIYKNKFNILYLKNLIISGVLGLSLSAFFTLPVLFENKLVQIDSMFQNYYHYSVHFVSFFQLFFSNFWGDGPSVWGTADQMPFMIGYLHWILPAFLSIYSLYQIYRGKNKNIALITLLISGFGLFTAFMTHQKSGLIWQYLTTVQKIQFPWRFLNHASFFFSFAAGALAVYLKNYRYKNIVYGLLIICLVFINWNHFFPITHGPITDAQKMSGLAWNNQITSGIYDYLPKTASTAAKSKAQEIIDFVKPDSVEYQILSHQQGTDWDLVNIDLKQEATITFSRLYFPNFSLTENNKIIPIQIEPELGRIQAKLSAGQHQLYLKLHNTPIRSFSNYLSLLAWIYLVWRLLILKK